MPRRPTTISGRCTATMIHEVCEKHFGIWGMNEDWDTRDQEAPGAEKTVPEFAQHDRQNTKRKITGNGKPRDQEAPVAEKTVP